MEAARNALTNDRYRRHQVLVDGINVYCHCFVNPSHQNYINHLNHVHDALHLQGP
jgi:hypothetical protein